MAVARRIDPRVEEERPPARPPQCDTYACRVVRGRGGNTLSIRCTVSREISEDDPVDGARVTAQLDHIWTKYTGNAPPYGLRDPSLHERRVLFELTVDRIATFGRP